MASSFKRLSRAFRSRAFCSNAPQSTAAEWLVAPSKIITVLEGQVHDLKQERKKQDRWIEEEKSKLHEMIAHIQEEKNKLYEIIEEYRKEKAEMKVQHTLALLRLSGRNDTRGLFEAMQEVLEIGLTTIHKLRGQRLWEAILRQNRVLAKCIEAKLNVPAKDILRQATDCYSVYTFLSSHVHSGKPLAALQASSGNKILFQRAEMAPDHVLILECIAHAAGFDIAEDPSSRPGTVVVGYTTSPMA